MFEYKFLHKRRPANINKTSRRRTALSTSNSSGNMVLMPPAAHVFWFTPGIDRANSRLNKQDKTPLAEGPLFGEWL